MLVNNTEKFFSLLEKIRPIFEEEGFYIGDTERGELKHIEVFDTCFFRRTGAVSNPAYVLQGAEPGMGNSTDDRPAA